MKHIFWACILCVTLSCNAISQNKNIELYTTDNSEANALFHFKELTSYTCNEIETHPDSVKRVLHYSQNWNSFACDSIASIVSWSKKFNIKVKSKRGMCSRQDSLHVINKWFDINELLEFDGITQSSELMGIDLIYTKVRENQFITVNSEALRSRYNAFIFDISDSSNIKGFGFEFCSIWEHSLGDFNNDGIIDLAVFDNKDITNQDEESNFGKITVYNYINYEFVKNENYYLITEYDTTQNKTYVNKEKSEWFFPLE